MSADVVQQLLQQNQQLVELLTAQQAEGSGGSATTRRPRKERSMRTHTVSSLMEVWLKEREAEGIRDVYNERLRWKTHIKPEKFAQRPIDTVVPLDLRRFVKEKRKTHSWQTTKHCLRQIKQVFDMAYELQLISHNPALTINMKKQTRTSKPWTYLQPEEIELIQTSEHLTDLERRGIMLAIFTGLRQGELRYQRWEDTHFRRATPFMEVRYSNGDATKGGEPGETSLLPMAVEILEEMAAEDPSGGCEGLLFPNPRTGEAFPKGYDFGWSDKVRGDKVQAGAKTRAGIIRPVRFHDLRHTAAAALISGYWEETWRLEEVKAFMRHKSISMTQRYAHLHPDNIHRKAARTRMKAGGQISAQAGGQASDLGCNHSESERKSGAADETRTRALRRDRPWDGSEKFIVLDRFQLEEFLSTGLIPDQEEKMTAYQTLIEQDRPEVYEN